MPYVIAVLLGLLCVVMGFSQHYKNELQATSAKPMRKTWQCWQTISYKPPHYRRK